MKLTIRDHDEGFIDAAKVEFADFPEVKVELGDIFARPAEALVSPANSFGFMDGGIDMAYSRKFGWQLSERIKAWVAEEGLILPGQLKAFTTGSDVWPSLIVLPTMVGPMGISNTLNVFVAFYALCRHYQGIGIDIVCPGLGTGVGDMPYGQSARQMRMAYQAALHTPKFDKSGQVHRWAVSMIS